MQWNELNSELQLSEITKRSMERPQVIFKHSSRCSISSVVKNRLERNYKSGAVDFYFLDLIKHRSLSTKIAEQFNVWHESPQVLLIKNGECIYDESHSGISIEELIEQSDLK